METKKWIIQGEQYESVSRSVIGGRNEQQDAVFIDCEEDKSLFAVLCDGMGGCEHGGTASRLTIDLLQQLYQEKLEDQKAHDFYLYAIDLLDEQVFNLKNEDGEKLRAGTTVVSVFIKNQELNWMSVGDSRLYIIRDRQIAQVTRDHNYFLRLKKQLKEKKITEEEYERKAQKGNALISFIGVGGIKTMDISKIPFKLQKDDIIILTSDGLYGAVSDSEVLNIVIEEEDLVRVSEKLLYLAEQHAGKAQDNTSFIIIRAKGRDEDESSSL